jgi:hypothetical protein
MREAVRRWRHPPTRPLTAAGKYQYFGWGRGRSGSERQRWGHFARRSLWGKRRVFGRDGCQARQGRTGVHHDRLGTGVPLCPVKPAAPPTLCALDNTFHGRPARSVTNVTLRSFEERRKRIWSLKIRRLDYALGISSNERRNRIHVSIV